jgi:SAM-dependent methyltransferase
MRRLQRRLGCYDVDDLEADLRGDLCRVITAEKFILRLLGIEVTPAVKSVLPAHCIAYVSSRLSDVPTLIARMEIGPEDVFFDIGAGLGGVSILVAWMTGAMVHGIEFHPEFCRLATAAARAFQVPNVRFTHADARDVSYADGNKFFLYLPFTHEVQAAVLERLRKVAADQPITIGWQGPAEHLLAYPWLEEVPPPPGTPLPTLLSLKIFRSRTTPRSEE